MSQNTFSNNRSLLDGMSITDRVAQFCILLGEDATVKIFQHLSPRAIEKVSMAISSVSSIDKETSLAILDEFYLYIKSKAFIGTGGFEYAKDLLYKSLGKNEADIILDRLSAMRDSGKVFFYLKNINPSIISNFIKDESPQTIAVILSHMDSVAAAKVLNNLNSELKTKITIQMAMIKNIQPSVVRTISNVLEKKLESLLSSGNMIGGVKTVATILNKMGSKSAAILSNITASDPQLAQDIKDNMFLFEDLLGLSTEDLVKLLANIELNDAVIALSKSTSEDINIIFQAMSQRVQTRFKEESELVGNVKIKEIEEAQQKMLNIAQRLIDEGSIDMGYDQ